jgi:hypothetical protein
VVVGSVVVGQVMVDAWFSVFLLGMMVHDQAVVVMPGFW